MSLSPRRGRRVALCLIGLILAGATMLPAGQAAANGTGPYRATIPTNDPHVFAFEAPPANFDPTTASTAELKRYGFPLPPDPTSHPKQYQIWADDMRHAKREVVPSFTVQSGVKAAESSPSWSGAVAHTHQPTCSPIFCGLPDSPTEVVGAWTVPNVARSTQTSFSSTWVGLDGDGNLQVEQMGTEQDATVYCVLPNLCSTSTNYYAWYELWPDNQIRIPNFPVGPGDRMYADVQYDASTNVLNFFLHDYTRGEYTPFSVYAKYGCGCGSAEWITERTSINNTLPALANFGQVLFTSADFRAVVNGWQSADTPYFGSDSMDMRNASGHYLASGGFPGYPDEVLCTWDDYS